MYLYSHFPAYVPKAFSQSFQTRDHCEKVVFICVPVEVDVIVPWLLDEMEVHFCLELVENPVQVNASAECHMAELVFLFQ